MPLTLLVWCIVLLLVGLIWLSRHVELSRVARSHRRLRPGDYPAPLADAGKLSVIVAAKEEEQNIRTCIESLLEQDYPNLEIIAVNDRSADRTGAILDELAATAPDKLRVVHVKQLPEGWFGKNNAMREGVAVSTGEWLCFIDADCRQTSTDTMSVAMHEALSNKIDFLSVLPVLETRSFWERLIQPVCAAILMIWFRPERVNDPHRRTAYANGAFMLMSRATYEAIGGHESVRTELNEDIHMARLCKERGRRLFVIENDGLYVTRMYTSLVETWRGWSRIFYGCFGTFRRLAVTLLVVLLLSVLPLLSFVIAAMANVSSAGQPGPGWLNVFALSAVVIVVLESVIWRFMRLARSAPWAWMTYPVGILIATGMLLKAMTKLAGARTNWRGTTYRRRDHDEGAAAGEARPKETQDPSSAPVTDVA
jgi:chlorobactene glucosyltransferase